MPYIELPNYPGIVALLIHDKDVAKHLTGLAQTIMRRPAKLSVGERELIASYVSRLNGCNFCCGSHSACAAKFLDPQLVTEVVTGANRFHQDLSPKMQALLTIAANVRSLNFHEEYPGLIQAAKDAGADDSEIHDTVLIAAFFCMCNRYVDGLGTTYDSGDLEQGGKSLAEYGYVMSIKRFVKEIVPDIGYAFMCQFSDAVVRWFS